MRIQNENQQNTQVELKPGTATQVPQQPTAQQPSAPARTGALADYERSCKKKTDHWFVASLIAFLLIVVGSGIVVVLYQGFGIDIDATDMQKAAAEAGISPAAYEFWKYSTFIGIWILTFIWMAVRREDRPLFRFMRPDKKGNRFRWIPVGILAGFAANGFCILMSVVSRNVELEYTEPSVGWMLLLFLAVVIQSGAEELICRGYLFQKLRRRYRSPWVAIILTMLMFAGFHLGNDGLSFWAILNLLEVGLLLALVVNYFNSFWWVVFFHTAWNYTQNILFGLRNSGQDAVYSMFRQKTQGTNGFFFDTGFGVEGSPGAVLILGLMILGILIFVKRKKLRPVDLWEKEDRDEGRIG